MSEQAPDTLRFDPSTGILSVPTGDGVKLGTPVNTSIYMHPFAYRGADHIFLETGETDEQILGAFIFRIASDLLVDNFDDLVGQLVEADFEMIVADSVSDCDWEQFNNTVDRFVAKVDHADLDYPWEFGDE